MLDIIVYNLEQCWQQDIVQCSFHQARADCSFFAVYTGTIAPAVNAYALDKATSAVQQPKFNNYK